MHDNSRILAQISNQLFQTLARVFPVTSTSDELHEFPQIVPENPCWEHWGCSSKDYIDDMGQKLTSWKNQLAIIFGDAADSDLMKNGLSVTP